MYVFKKVAVKRGASLKYLSQAVFSTSSVHAHGHRMLFAIFGLNSRNACTSTYRVQDSKHLWIWISKSQRPSKDNTLLAGSSPR